MAGLDLSKLFDDYCNESDLVPIASSTILVDDSNDTPIFVEDEANDMPIFVEDEANDSPTLVADEENARPILVADEHDTIMISQPLTQDDQLSQSQNVPQNLPSNWVAWGTGNSSSDDSTDVVTTSVNSRKNSRHPPGFSFGFHSRTTDNSQTRRVPRYSADVQQYRYHPYRRTDTGNSGWNLSAHSIDTIAYALGAQTDVPLNEIEEEDNTNASIADNADDEQLTQRLKSILETGKIISWEQLVNEFSRAKYQYGKEKYWDFIHDRDKVMACLKKIYEQLSARPEGMVDTPGMITRELKTHQKEGLKFLLWRETQDPPGGILADDMGLGKTLSIISLIAATKFKRAPDILLPAGIKYIGKTLVICPATLTHQWEDEINKSNDGDLNVLVHHGHTKVKKAGDFLQYDVVITSYNLVLNDHKYSGSLLFSVYWTRIVLDEGHCIRNSQSQQSLAIRALHGRNRWILTGTPIHNRIDDLFPYVDFLRCTPFNERTLFLKWTKGSEGVARLHVLMKALLLRRTKRKLQETGLVQLPVKEVTTFTYELDEKELKVYKNLMIFSQTVMMLFLNSRNERQNQSSMYDFSSPEFNEMRKRIVKKNQGRVNTSDILTLLLRLRQLCCHPTLIQSMLSTDERAKEVIGTIEEEDDINIDDTQDMLGEIISEVIADDETLCNSNEVYSVERPSTKISMLIKILEDRVKPTGEKAIIVSEWTSYLDIIAEQIEYHLGLSYERYTGQVPLEERDAIVNRFNSKSMNPRILLVSLTAGGVGLNLIGANHVFLVTVHWNPQLERQAQDRVFRINQSKNVHVYKFRAADTIEQRIFDLQKKKIELADKVLEGSNTTRLTLEDLKALFGLAGLEAGSRSHGPRAITSTVAEEF